MKIEIRNDVAVISGYVNAVGRDSRPIADVRGKFVEQIEPGAFRASLERSENVDLLLNHDKSRVYASTKDGSLQLTEDSIGLRAEAVLTDAEMIRKARSGEFRGWSFGMYVGDSAMEERAEGIPRRHVKSLNMFEVSLIDKSRIPCYVGTSVECRSDGEILAELRYSEEEPEIIEEERSEPEPVDYSAVDDVISELRYGAVDNAIAELRYNPYHDPSNGRFTSGGGGGGGVLVVEKGQKGKGFYVVDIDHDEEYEKWKATKSNMEKTISRLEKSNIDYIDVKKLEKPLTSDEIVDKISGGDKTAGSCASVAFAYIGNEAGYDVYDYRGGTSQKYFSNGANLEEIAIQSGGTVFRDKNAIKSTFDTLKLEVEEGKTYYLVAGCHAAVVRKNAGKYEYLELQHPIKSENGFKELNPKTLHDRFGAKRSVTRYGYKLNQTGILIESSKLANNSDFRKMLGYINTAEKDQMKGKSGNVK